MLLCCVLKIKSINTVSYTHLLGKKILNQLQENLKIAGEDMIPIWQDTGMAVFFIEIEMCIRDRARSRDLKLCQTTVGPHRDDMLFSNVVILFEPYCEKMFTCKHYASYLRFQRL